MKLVILVLSLPLPISFSRIIALHSLIGMTYEGVYFHLTLANYYDECACYVTASVPMFMCHSLVIHNNYDIYGGTSLLRTSEIRTPL